MSDEQQNKKKLCAICGETANHEVLIPSTLSVWCHLCKRCKQLYNPWSKFIRPIQKEEQS